MEATKACRTLVVKHPIGNTAAVTGGSRAVFRRAVAVVAVVMAAHSNNFIRVRLHFDYPPPAVVDCRMCWLLVDLNTCRVVADLESIIREKFEFSRRSILSLFIEECYLPHTESIYVVRDNDSVRCASRLLCDWCRCDILQESGISTCQNSFRYHCYRFSHPCVFI